MPSFSHVNIVPFALKIKFSLLSKINSYTSLAVASVLLCDSVAKVEKLLLVFGSQSIVILTSSRLSITAVYSSVPNNPSHASPNDIPFFIFPDASGLSLIFSRI